jgi:hypothetical protein
MIASEPFVMNAAAGRGIIASASGAAALASWSADLGELMIRALHRASFPRGHCIMSFARLRR